MARPYDIIGISAPESKGREPYTVRGAGEAGRLGIATLSCDRLVRSTSLDPDDVARERERWRSAARRRPAHIPRPKAGEESVWDYPRPPRLEAVPERIRVEFAGQIVADSLGGRRVLETAGPPVYYFPPEDLRREYLVASPHESLCEWKGIASYFSLCVGNRSAEYAAWSYADPDPAFAPIRGAFAFHAGKVDACFVGEARVTPQPGEYYGGWITPGILGPFKGEPGSEDW